MTIHRYNPGTPLAVGQWVNCDSAIRDAIAGPPRRITKITPHTIAAERLGESVWRKTAIRFISDSEAEAKAIHELSLHIMIVEDDQTRKLAADQRAGREAAIDSLVELLNCKKGK